MISIHAPTFLYFLGRESNKDIQFWFLQIPSFSYSGKFHACKSCRTTSANVFYACSYLQKRQGDRQYIQ